MKNLKGIDSLEAFMDKKALEIEVVDPEIVTADREEKACERLCAPEDMFDQIERCKICGRLS